MNYTRVFRCFALAILLGTPTAQGAGPRVLDESQRPNDVRLSPPKDLNGYFPFVPSDTNEEWTLRSEKLRRRVLVATGLWPMPEKTPLNPVIHGKVLRPGFSVEKVYLESFPGHFVTGLLFRPTSGKGPFPGVLSPHGHGGRMQDYGESQIKKLVELGQEKFVESGRFPKLARCAQLARMGCVVFIYDMLGYVDSVQISYELAHRFSKQRPDLDDPQRWGLFSTQAELRMQSVFGIQTWNSVRALDFLAQLPDVDTKRLGVTGGSGGGTQTIILGAIDPRPIVSFPQGMVSTSMQGGCTCENASLLRIGTGNVELAGLFAPRPMAMTGANDWTKEIATKGYPQLQSLYAMLGKPDNVLSRSFLEFPHNYNAVTRAMMYEWFNQHLQLGLDSPIVEQDYQLLTTEEASVWNSEHPRPESGVAHEVDLLTRMDAASEVQRLQLIPRKAAELPDYRRVTGGAIETLIGRTFDQVAEVERTKVFKEDRGTYWRFGDLLNHAGEQIPVVSFYPRNTEWNGRVVIWIDGEGKQGIFNSEGVLHPGLRGFVESGSSVISADLIFQGEFLTDGKRLETTPVVSSPREYSGYTHGYNHTVFAQRVHDLLTLIKFVRSYASSPEEVDIVGIGAGGPLVAAAAAVSRGELHRVAVDTAGFRFRDLKSYRDPMFLPGMIKYGDVPALLALVAPARLLIAGEGTAVPPEVRMVYKASGDERQATATAVSGAELTPVILNWLKTP